MSKKMSIISLVVVLIIGTLGHFVFSWTNSILFAFFFPVNESIFEHMKLTFFPFVLLGLYRYTKLEKSKFFFKLALSSLIGALCIPTLYYFYTFFIESNPIINIIIFIISCIIQEFLFYKLMNSNNEYKIENPEGIITIFAITLAFVVFTFYPPKFELFKDPTNSTYGYFKLKEP